MLKGLCRKSLGRKLLSGKSCPKIFGPVCSEKFFDGAPKIKKMNAFLLNLGCFRGVGWAPRFQKPPPTHFPGLPRHKAYRPKASVFIDYISRHLSRCSAEFLKNCHQEKKQKTLRSKNLLVPSLLQKLTNQNGLPHYPKKGVENDKFLVISVFETSPVHWFLLKPRNFCLGHIIQEHQGILGVFFGGKNQWETHI